MVYHIWILWVIRHIHESKFWSVDSQGVILELSRRCPPNWQYHSYTLEVKEYTN